MDFSTDERELIVSALNSLLNDLQKAEPFDTVSVQAAMALRAKLEEDTPDYEWILEGGYEAKMLSWRPLVYRLTRDNGETAELTFGTGSLAGRVLINGKNVELDERVWGLTDELSGAKLMPGEVFFIDRG
jgi:hypothetical protein